MKRKTLEFQADQIEMVLARHKVPGRVTGGLVSPRWVKFDVLPTLGARVSKVKGLAEELALALGADACRVARHRLCQYR
jgi:S-DNA-T family DNA segregation ATPase FtsK/SpoIIIE